MLKLFWNGLPIVEVDGKPAHLETRKVTALLAYLSLNPKGFPREKLATLFWPEFDQVHALANLRRALSSLSHSVPSQLLDITREAIHWNEMVSPYNDVVEFQEGLRSVRTHDHSEPELCPTCLETLDHLSTLYRGEFLEGLNLPDCPEFDDWQYLFREELKREFAWIFEQLVRGWAHREDWEKAIKNAQRWVSLDRLDEGAQRTLVEIYARAGQRSQAQRQYEEFARLLKAELGQEPDEEMQKQYQAILSHARLPVQEAKPAQDQRRQPRTLLKTKLYIPQIKPVRVSRHRLLSRLEEIGSHKVFLISAPAGFGKTSLLAEWAVLTENLVGWLSLDAGDNDPSCFLTYLCAALESASEGVSANALALLESPHPLNPPSIINALLNDVEKVDSPVVLVLDDYQFLTAQLVHETLAYLLEHATQNLHLVIASRSDPPIPLSRLRAHQELLEIRTADLRFTLEEAVQFFNQVMRLDISVEDIQSLEARTEGWIAGLQMAALSLQGNPDRARFIQTFSGSQRYILDYLIEEVLNRQPEPIQQFLLKTSVLERLCDSLCEAVIGEQGIGDRGAGGSSSSTPYSLPHTPSNTQAVLEYLEKTNLFLVPLDGERRWYRYHHLFADLLASQLQRLQPQLLPELHARASLWYEENGQVEQAIEHALANKDFERVANLIERNEQSLTIQVNFSKLQNWINRIPEEMVLRRPWIGITQGWIWIVAGKLAKLGSWMDLVEQNLQCSQQDDYSESQRRDMAAEIASIRAYIAFFRGDLNQTIELAGQALQFCSPKNDGLRVRILQQMGESYLVLQDLAKADECFQQVIGLGVRIQDFQSTTTASIRFYKTLKLLGKLNEAEEMLNLVMRALSDSGRAQTPVAAKPELCLGDLLRVRGQMEAAQKLLDQGLSHSRQYNIPYDTVLALTFKTRLLYTLGKWDEALLLLEEAVPLLESYSAPPAITDTWALQRASVWMKKGDVGRVEGWIEEKQLRWDDAPTYMREEALIFLARFLIGQGKQEQAQALLAKLAQGAENARRNGNLVQVLLLQALSLQAQGETGQALDVLMRCLSLAMPQGYQSDFLDEGMQAYHLLKAVQGQGLEKPMALYVESLIQAFERLSVGI